MTAALTQHQPGRHDGLRPTNLARDLYQIAELVELCFATRLDANGRATVREMKFISRLGPLLWLLSLLGLTGALGSGFVWRAGRRVVGNTSLYRGGSHPYLGSGWLIANVAVHPDHRRRGIAHALMQASLDQVRRQRGRWVALQVEADNHGAISLYEGLGFRRFETVTQWESRSPTTPPPPSPEVSTAARYIRRRRAADALAETELIFLRARRGAMAWTRPIERYHVQGTLFGDLDDLLDGQSRGRWVLPDRDRPQKLLGSAWASLSGWRRCRVSLFLDPALDDPAARQALLRHVLTRPDIQGRTIEVETTTGDEPVEQLLRAANFYPVRSLLLMRWSIDVP
jgi:GNAT superfamily N-acetyltransferase